MTRVKLTERNGPCGAVRRGLPCPCLGYEYLQTVAGYRDCDCGHSQQMHAPGPPQPEVVKIRTCPTCGQVLPEERP